VTEVLRCDGLGRLLQCLYVCRLHLVYINLHLSKCAFAASVTSLKDSFAYRIVCLLALSLTPKSTFPPQSLLFEYISITNLRDERSADVRYLRKIRTSMPVPCPLYVASTLSPTVSYNGALSVPICYTIGYPNCEDTVQFDSYSTYCTV
jgi:hypothetical protein